MGGADDVSRELRQVRDQAEQYRAQARRHEQHLQSAMETLARGWQGGDSHAVLSSINSVHESVQSRLAAYARRLDDRETELQRASRSAQEEPGGQTPPT